MSAWPPAVWGAAVMRGLDARARGEVEASGALRRVAPGERLFSPGDAADTFFVVAEGECELSSAGGRAVRRAARGEAFGEEATLRAFGTRGLVATCTSKAVVAEVRAAVFRRASLRGGGAREAVIARVERTLRRAATADVLRATSLLRALSTAELDALLDTVEPRELQRGEPLHRPGDEARVVYLVADGLLGIPGGDGALSYATRGEVLDGEGDARALGAYGAGAAWVLAVPRAILRELSQRHPGLVDLVENAGVASLAARASRSAQAALVAAGSGGEHALVDLHRLDVARSLLAIDQEVCVRCGQCAWACASVHDDGLSRLARTGDRIVVPQLREGERAPTATLLLPVSCQHCAEPTCLPSCPTGAIARDAGGAVRIRDALCIGCGQCAKACAWDNIEMVARPPSPKRALPLVAAETKAQHAVKCDLCEGSSGGPACVRACPVEAAVRIVPAETIAHVAAAAGRATTPRLLPPRARAWPWVAGAAVAAAGLAAHPMTRATSGALCGALLVALAGYAAVKRLLVSRVRARPHYIAHLALGALSAGAVVTHAGARFTANAAGALLVVFWATAAFGAFAALAYRLLPARLSRVERGGVLPESLGARAEELDARIFRALTGKADGTKAVYARILRPYADAWTGGLALLARGASLDEEEQRLGESVARVLEGRSSSGVEALVKLAVERRALRAQRLVQGVLRGLVPVHVALAATAVALLAVHVVFALRVYR